MKLCDQFLCASNGKPPSSVKALVRTFREIEHNDIVSPGLFEHEFPDNNAREWTKHASITLEEGTEAFMVEVIAKSHCYKQQLISCSFSTCLLLRRGKEVGKSWNSPTCAWP